MDNEKADKSQEKNPDYDKSLKYFEFIGVFVQRFAINQPRSELDYSEVVVFVTPKDKLLSVYWFGIVGFQHSWN